MRKLLLMMGICSGFLVSCCVGPRYSPQCFDIPDGWKGNSCEDCAEGCFTNWWEVFGDERLNELEACALANNPGLEAACYRIQEARAQAEIAGSVLYPQITLNPLYTDTGQLFKLFIPQGLVPIGDPTFRIVQFQYVLPLVMNYELDLWGRLRRQYQAASAGFEASLFDYDAVMLSLTTELASAYFQMRVLDAQLAILRESIEVKQEYASLTRSRYKKGLVSASDANSAEASLANAEASLNDGLMQRALLENMLATLVGVAASDFCEAENPIQDPPPSIPAGMPSDLLLQRPDVAAAERTAAQEHALVGAAYASFLPSIALTGALGYSSPVFREFLRWDSRYWQMQAEGAQDIFDGGYNCGNLKEAWALYFQASANYRDTVIQAFREVEDALAGVEFDGGQYHAYERAALAVSNNATLNRSRYSKGLENRLEVLNAESQRLDAELNQSIALNRRYVSTLNLIKAIGGSFEPPSEKSACPCQCNDCNQ